MWFINPVVSVIALLELSATVYAATPTPDVFSSTISSKLWRTSASFNNKYPQVTDHGNPARWELLGVQQWTSGFFPATFYEMNRRQNLCPAYSDGLDWLGRARTWTTGITPLQYGNSGQHDQGFLSLPLTYELKLNPSNQAISNGLVNFAKLLANRYNSKVGCTSSWNATAPDFRVIIDNMMNLDLLYISNGIKANSTLTSIAEHHANATIKNHFRSDYSTYHVVHYNSNTGAVTSRVTSQGYADSSTWTRGQAWAIHGYANMFNRTRYPVYLETSRQAAKLYLQKLPSSFIPPWDFNAPGNPATADTSAGAIVASALLQLATLERSIQNTTGSAYYANAAINILNGISSLGWKPTWDSILSNGTANYPAGGYQTGLVYGDYYYVKATNDLIAYGFADCSVFASGGTTTSTTKPPTSSTTSTKPPSSTSTSAPPPPPSTTGSLIKPRADSSKCLTASSNTNGASVTIQPCTSSSSSQLWTYTGIVAGSSGALKVYGTKCLDMTDGNIANGTKMQIYECGGSGGVGNKNQQWSVTGDNRIAWTGMGQCLDLTDGKSTNGNVIQAWHCTTGNNNQVWYFSSP